MIRIKLPQHLYLVKTHYDDKGYIRRANLEWDQSVKAWLDQQLGYVPDFEGPITPYVKLPTEEFVTAFKIAWY